MQKIESNSHSKKIMNAQANAEFSHVVPRAVPQNIRLSLLRWKQSALDKHDVLNHPCRQEGQLVYSETAAPSDGSS